MEQFLDYFVPERYTIKLAFHKKEKTFSGLVIIDGEAKSETIKLHTFKNLSIKTILVGEDEAKNFKSNNEEIIINEIGKKKQTISIAFDGTLKEDMEGPYISTYKYNGKTETVIATQFESHYARECFPCIDEPAAKAVFSLSIAVDDVENIILSNTDSIYEKTTEKTKFVRFADTPRMSTYLLAFVIGNFHGKTITNSHGVKITTYAPLNQPIDSVDFANDVAAKSLEYYDDEFGVPYPLTKCDQVALPDFEAGAMENWGLVTYRESMLLADKTATLGTKKSVALTVAHELSHQWFGDLVTMKWWDDLWLNESFASIMEYMAVDSIYPDFKIWENFFIGDCLAALKRDAYTDVQSVHQQVNTPAEIATLFDGAIVYAKGARLMLMLIRSMGWENFKKGIKEYFEKYAYKNTIGDNLWDSLKPYADFDPKEFMHAWIENPGYPVISKNSQTRFTLDKKMSGESKWPIPHLNDDMSGHYVINLENDEFDKKLNNFDNLSLEQKLRLLIDKNLLSKTDLAKSADLLPLLQKFKNEDSAAVWGIIANIIAGLKIFFKTESKEEKDFKNFINDLISEKSKTISLEKETDENIIRLRSIILGLAYYAENKEILQKLSNMCNENLEKLDPELRSDILDAKIYCDPSILDNFLKMYQNTADPDIKYDLLFAITLTKDEKNIDKLVPLLKDQNVIKPQDHLHFYIYLYRNRKASEKVLDWLFNNWDFVKTLAGDKTIEDYPRYTANSIYDKETADKFMEFFKDKKDDNALQRALKIAESEINARIKLVEEDSKDIYAALSK